MRQRHEQWNIFIKYHFNDFNHFNSHKFTFRGRNMNNLLSIKKVVEAELKTDLCELIKDESFKALLRHALRKNINTIDASAILIDYTKNNYIMEL